MRIGMLKKYLLLQCCMLCGCSCLIKGAENGSAVGPEPDALAEILDSVMYGRDMDWKFEVSRRLYDSGLESGREDLLLYGSTLLGISYLYAYDLDSSVYWLNNSIVLDSMEIHVEDLLRDRIMAITYNNLGLVYINLAIDYYKAAGYFIDALHRVDKEDSPGLYVTLLTNLSLVHYFRNDPSGLEYAEECYEFETGRGGSPTFMSAYSMALMLYVNGRYADALTYADLLRSMENTGKDASPYDLRNAIQTEIIYGKILLAKGDDDGARAAFQRAIAIPAGDFRADVAGAYLCYGEYLARSGQYEEALQILKRGLELGRSEANYVHLQEFYEKVAELYEMMRMPEKALEYYKQYQSVSDSIMNISKEFALYEARAEYQVARYENLLRDRQITILKKEKEEQFYIFVCVVIFCTAVAVWFYQKKKNLYYKKIVRQYQEKVALSRMIRESPQERYCYSALSDDKNEELFVRVKDLMENGKAYRDGTLTLDKLAVMLSTNRSYLSRVINEKTGLGFNKYVNSFRVAEAVEILSDKSAADRQMKEIGSSLGFNSPSTFYKAFSEETGMSPSAFRRKIVSSDL